MNLNSFVSKYIEKSFLINKRVYSIKQLFDEIKKKGIDLDVEFKF